MRVDYSGWWEDMVETARANASILFALAAAFVFLPNLLLSAAIVPPAPPPDVPTASDILAQFTNYYRDNWLPELVKSLLSVLGLALLFTVLLDARRPSVGDAFRLALPLLLPLLVLTILVNLTLGLGIALFVVPGLYLLGRTAVATPSLVAERRMNPLAACARSFALTAGQGWRIFFFMLLVFLVAGVIYLATGGVIGLLAGFLPGADDPWSLRRLLVAALDALFTAVFWLLAALLAVTLYRRLAGTSSGT